MLIGVSGALYKTAEIWSKTDYDASHDGKKAKNLGGFYNPGRAGTGIQSGGRGGSSQVPVAGFEGPQFKGHMAMGGSQLR